MVPCSHDGGTPQTPGRARAERLLSMQLGADWVAPSLARDRVTSWLRLHDWPQEELEDVVFAVSEAVSNSVEHGYEISADDVAADGQRTGGAVIEVRGEVTTAREGGRQVVLSIRDDGSWKAPSPTPTDRGRGLPLMRVSMSSMRVSGGATGTTVHLRSRAVP